MSPLAAFRLRPMNDPPRSRRGFTILELLVVLGIIAVLIALVIPTTRMGNRGAARRIHCRNNLKQIGLALHNYHDTYGAFPPAYTVDPDGKPLHSWRTLILPYLDQKPLYDRIDLSKPWNDPINTAVFQEPLLSQPYRCPSASLPNDQTTYLAIVTPHSALQATEPRRIKDITDGTSNTILVIEVDGAHAVPWMSPNDADEALLLSFSPQSKPTHAGMFHVLFGDGHVWSLSTKLSQADRRALVTAAGKDEGRTEP